MLTGYAPQTTKMWTESIRLADELETVLEILAA